MHVLIFVSLMCICLPNLFLSWHDQYLKIAIHAQLSSAWNVFKIKHWPKKQLNYTLALFKMSCHRIGLAQIWHISSNCHLLISTCTRFEVVHNRSIEFADHGQLCNYTTHLFTTACVTHVDQVIKQFVVLMGIINVERGDLFGYR